MNTQLKNVLISSLSVLSIEASAQNLATKEYLISQCRSLSQNISSLVERQNKVHCMQQLNLASTQVAEAGDLIVDDAYLFAKKSLDNAATNLQYSALGNCSQYIQISHAKAQAQRIKSSL